jgi:hypothetical protein
MWFQFIGIGAASATVVIESSIDKTNFNACTGSLTADQQVEVPNNTQLLRVNRTVAGSGAITCVGVGWSEQS